MYTYVTQELPALLASDAMDPLHRISLQYRSISGHSMGGHGALTIAFKQPEAWCSVSALAPIVDPTAGAEACPWGAKALNGYLATGTEGAEASAYSAVKLLEASAGSGGFKDQLGEILVDQGGDDEFLNSQLTPGRLQAAAEVAKQPLRFRTHAGYDHSYFFVSSFIAEHVEFAAKGIRTKAAKVAAEAEAAAEAKAKEEAAAAASTAAATSTLAPIECQAMVAFAPKEPLKLETVRGGWVMLHLCRFSSARPTKPINVFCVRLL